MGELDIPARFLPLLADAELWRVFCASVHVAVLDEGLRLDAEPSRLRRTVAVRDDSAGADLGRLQRILQAEARRMQRRGRAVLDQTTWSAWLRRAVDRPADLTPDSVAAARAVHRVLAFHDRVAPAAVAAHARAVAGHELTDDEEAAIEEHNEALHAVRALLWHGADWRRALRDPDAEDPDGPATQALRDLERLLAGDALGARGRLAAMADERPAVVASFALLAVGSASAEWVADVLSPRSGRHGRRPSDDFLRALGWSDPFRIDRTLLARLVAGMSLAETLHDRTMASVALWLGVWRPWLVACGVVDIARAGMSYARMHVAMFHARYRTNREARKQGLAELRRTTAPPRSDLPAPPPTGNVRQLRPVPPAGPAWQRARVLLGYLEVCHGGAAAALDGLRERLFAPAADHDPVALP